MSVSDNAVIVSGTGMEASKKKESHNSAHAVAFFVKVLVLDNKLIQEPSCSAG